jgi:hypothetical protein
VKSLAAWAIVYAVRGLLRLLIALGFHKDSACGCCGGPLEDDRDAVCHGCTRRSPTPRPLWRWWLFCFASTVWFKTGWRWALNLLGWSVAPEWVAGPEEARACAERNLDAPF